MSERWVCLVPVGFIIPIVLFGQSIYNRIKGVVLFSASLEVHSFGMQLIADAVFVRASCGNNEEQRLFTGIAGAFGQNIIQFAVRLGVDFVKDETGYVKPVLRSGLC